VKNFENDMLNIFNTKNTIDFVCNCISHLNDLCHITPLIYKYFIDFVAYKYETGDENNRKILIEKIDELAEKWEKTKEGRLYE
jgi:hypothetical protein